MLHRDPNGNESRSDRKVVEVRGLVSSGRKLAILALSRLAPIKTSWIMGPAKMTGTYGRMIPVGFDSRRSKHELQSAVKAALVHRPPSTGPRTHSRGLE
jgi:hypothetical protein